MREQLSFFGASIALGVALYILYFLQRLLAKKTALLPVTIMLDFIWCGIAFAAFLTLSVYMAGGRFYYYPVCGTLAGFFGAMAAAQSIPRRKIKKVEKDKPAEPPLHTPPKYKHSKKTL